MRERHRRGWTIIAAVFAAVGLFSTGAPAQTQNAACQTTHVETLALPSGHTVVMLEWDMAQEAACGGPSKVFALVADPQGLWTGAVSLPLDWTHIADYLDQALPASTAAALRHRLAGLLCDPIRQCLRGLTAEQQAVMGDFCKHLPAAHPGQCDDATIDAWVQGIVLAASNGGANPEAALAALGHDMVLSEAALSHPGLRMLLGRGALFVVPPGVGSVWAVSCLGTGACQWVPNAIPLGVTNVRAPVTNLAVETFSGPNEPWPEIGHLSCNLKWTAPQGGRFEVWRVPAGAACTDPAAAHVSCGPIAPGLQPEGQAGSGTAGQGRFRFREQAEGAACADAANAPPLAAGQTWDYCVCSMAFGVPADCHKATCSVEDRRAPLPPRKVDVFYEPIAASNSDQVKLRPHIVFECPDPADASTIELYRTDGDFDSLGDPAVGAANAVQSFAWSDVCTTDADGKHRGDIADAQVNSVDQCGSVLYYCLKAVDAAGNRSGCSAPVRVSMPCTKLPPEPSVQWCTIPAPGEDLPPDVVCIAPQPGKDVPIAKKGVSVRVQGACADATTGGRVRVYRRNCDVVACEGPFVRIAEHTCTFAPGESPDVAVEDPDPCGSAGPCRKEYAVELCNTAGVCSTKTRVLAIGKDEALGPGTILQWNIAEGCVVYAHRQPLEKIDYDLLIEGVPHEVASLTRHAAIARTEVEGVYETCSGELKLDPGDPGCIVVTPHGTNGKAGPPSKRCGRLDTDEHAPWPTPVADGLCLSSLEVRRVSLPVAGACPYDCQNFDNNPGSTQFYNWVIRPPFIVYRRATTERHWVKVTPLVTEQAWFAAEGALLCSAQPGLNFVKQDPMDCSIDFVDLLEKDPGKQYAYRFVEIDPATGHPRREAFYDPTAVCAAPSKP